MHDVCHPEMDDNVTDMLQEKSLSSGATVDWDGANDEKANRPLFTVIAEFTDFMQQVALVRAYT